MNHTTKQSGLTLAELMIAVFILAIIYTLATPGIETALLNSKLRDTSTNIYSTLMRAKAEAIRRGENVTILFNSPGNSYMVFMDNGTGGGGVANDQVRNGAELILVPATVFPDRVAFNPAVGGGDGVSYVGNASIFSPRGIPIGPGGGLGGGTVGLHVIDSNGNTLRQRTITVSTAGRILIQ